MPAHKADVCERIIRHLERGEHQVHRKPFLLPELYRFEQQALMDPDFDITMADEERLMLDAHPRAWMPEEQYNFLLRFCTNDKLHTGIGWAQQILQQLQAAGESTEDWPSMLTFQPSRRFVHVLNHLQNSPDDKEGYRMLKGSFGAFVLSSPSE